MTAPSSPPARVRLDRARWSGPRAVLLAVLALHAVVLVAAAAAAGTSPTVLAALVCAALTGGAVAYGVARTTAERPAQADGAHLSEAERVKTELVAVVSHEFRTPLTSIRGFAQTLEQRGDQMERGTVLACLRSIDGQARRLERIVANLLVVSGEVCTDGDEVADLAEVSSAVADELGAAPGAAAPTIDIDVPVGLRARVRADDAARVLGNLLDNALKFAAPGTRVRLRGWRAGAEVVVEVSDRGVPLADVDLERIFEPFVQADSSDSRRADGMGLGLSVVRRIVEAHGGRVEARNLGGEVAVVVTLPAAETSRGERLAAHHQELNPSTRRLTESSHGAG